MADKIVSKLPNKEYKDGWERIFGRRGKPRDLNDLSPAAIREAANSDWPDAGSKGSVGQPKTSVGESDRSNESPKYDNAGKTIHLEPREAGWDIGRDG